MASVKNKPSGLKLKELIRLFPAPRQKKFKAKSRILREGERANYCLLLLKGRVQITKKLPGAPDFKVAVVKPGEIFGEMGMLSGLARTASARALTNVETLPLTRADFESLLKKNHALGGRLAFHFSRTLAVRCSRVLNLLAKSTTRSKAGRKRQVDVRQVLHNVYSLWAV